MTTGLSDLPLETLLAIVQHLGTRDTLRLERTCTAFRNVGATHRRWFSKLTELGPHCAPDVPPHVDTNTLPYENLRDIVIRAQRSYDLMMKGPVPTADYVCVKSIFVPRPDGLSDPDQFRVLKARISPGGRYLLFQAVAAQCNELRLLDLENGNTCIWSLDLGTISENLRNNTSQVHLNLTVCRDGAIILAVAERYSPPGVNDDRGSFMVMRLCRNCDASASMEQTLVFASESYRLWRHFPLCCEVSERFVAIGSAHTINIVDLEEKRMVEFTLFLGAYPSTGQLWNDYYFFASRNSGPRPILCALSLVQAMKSSPDPRIEVGPDAPYITYVVPSEHAGARLHVIIMDFSLHSLAYKNETDTVMVSALAEVGYSPVEDIPFPGYLLSRLTFNSNRREWTHINSRVTGHESGSENISTDCRSRLTRTGRMLMLYRCRETGRKWHGLIAVDSVGNIISPRLPDDFASIPDERTRPDEADILQSYVEPSSGTMIRLKDRRSGKDVIELYRPA